MLFADRRFKMLVVLQGTDTSGKDGTIRGVFAKTSALGVRTAAWKAPSEEERAHDFLWRIHQKVPARRRDRHLQPQPLRGRPRAGGQGLDHAPRRRRSASPRSTTSSGCCVETGTVVLKFLLHISKEEQRERLQDRLDDPTKHWKFAVGDLEERTRWDAYQAAYGEAVGATGTPWAPWTIVPADSKTHRNLMIATVVKQSLEALKLRYPPGDPALANIKVI